MINIHDLDEAVALASRNRLYLNAFKISKVTHHCDQTVVWTTEFLPISDDFSDIFLVFFGFLGCSRD